MFKNQIFNLTLTVDYLLVVDYWYRNYFIVIYNPYSPYVEDYASMFPNI